MKLFPSLPDCSSCLPAVSVNYSITSNNGRTIFGSLDPDTMVLRGKIQPGFTVNERFVNFTATRISLGPCPP